MFKSRMLPVFGLSLALALGFAPSSQGGLFDAWGKSCKVTFSGYAGGATLTNFPALVVLSSGISGFNYADFQSNAADLRFEDSTGASLPYEIDTWNASGTSYVWVNVPLLSSSADYITAYWKNSGATAPTNSTQTWDASTRGVYHLGESLVNGAVGGTNRDSTAFANHGMQHYTAPVASAKIGGGQMPFTSGQDNYVRLPGSVITPAAYTKELWYRYDGTNAGALLNGAGAGTNTTLGIQIGAPHAFSAGNNDPGSASDINTAPVAWVHLVATYDGATMKLYTNAVLAASAADTQGTTPTNLYLFSTGAGWGCGGQADELRISSVARSAAWVLASYKTQGGNSSFQTYMMNTNGATSLIPTGSTWMYYDDGTLPAANWYSPAYSDVAWSNGAAPLGYANDSPISTTISYGADPANKWISYYFRKHFTIASLASVTGLVAQFEVDDGAVFYLNGSPIYTTTNMILPISNSSLCSSVAVEPYTWIPFTINPSMLTTGDNVLAVEVHQAGPGSSDVTMDMMLDAVAYATTNQMGGGSLPPVVPATPTNWTAYDDTAWNNDALLFNDTGIESAPVNATTNSPWSQHSGLLVDSTSGVPTPVTVTFSGVAAGIVCRDFTWPTGTDLNSVFEGHVGPHSAANWTAGTVTLTLSGLNTGKQYTVALWSSRGATTAAYSNRWTDITISSVDTFSNSSSVGNTKFTSTVANDSIRVVSVIDGGRIARFDSIRSGTDGTIVFNLTANGLASGDTNGYLNAYMVQESDAVVGGGGGGFVDTDGDGMDDNWELQYYGSLVYTANGDFDNDGSSNYDEYRAGTDPTSAGSKLQVTGETNSSGVVVMSWAGVAGKTYSVEQSTNLATSWNVLQSGIPGVSPTTTYTGAVGMARGFMRVKVE